MPNLQYLLIVYPVAAIIYGIGALGPRAHRQDKWILMTSLIPAIIPFMTALIIVYVFFVAGAARTVQFNVNADLQMIGWSLWVKSWMPLIFLNFVNMFGCLIWFADLAIRRGPGLKFALPCIALSILAPVTVFYNAPMA